MKSIKPGRGPSAMGATGSVVGIIFGIFWTVMVYTMTENSPFPFVHVAFPLFGLVFVGLGVANLIYNSVNATGRNRMSVFDITEEHEEPDPLNTFVRRGIAPMQPPVDKPAAHCSHCSFGLKHGFKFCPQCGKSV